MTDQNDDRHSGGHSREDYVSANYLPAEAAQAVVAAALAVPGVAQMYSGVVGEIALLYPRLRVPGLTVVSNLLEVQVAIEVDLANPLHIPSVIKQVHDAVATVIAQYPASGVIAVRVIAADAVASDLAADRATAAGNTAAAETTKEAAHE